MDWGKKLMIFAVLLIFFIPTVQAYQITYYGMDDAGTTLRPYSPSVYWAGTCTSNISLWATAGDSTAFSLSNRYLSPDDKIKGTSNPSFSSNITCRAFGTVDGGASLNGFYEGTVNTTHTADTINTWTRITYDCDYDANENFLYYGSWLNDTYGNHPFGYGIQGGSCFQNGGGCSNTLANEQSLVINTIQDGYYTTCGEELNPDVHGVEYHVTTCGGVNKDLSTNYWVVIPFNAMASGVVNITIPNRYGYLYNPAVGTLLYQHQIYLWDTVLNATENLGTTIPYTDSKNLVPYRDYWLFIGTRYYISNTNCGTGTMGVVHSYTNYTINMWAYEPNWNCEDWSDCTDSVETRLCIDPLGRVAPVEEFRTCSITVLENATLGFEDYYTDFGLVCVPDWDVFQGCQYLTTPQNKTRRIPQGWNLTETNTTVPRDYITMTNEWHSDGSLALKMWYIPPSNGEPISITTCGNLSYGRSPELQETNFTDVILETNITFPASNMLLSFDTRICHEVPEKHGGISEQFIFWNMSCDRECYGDCDSPLIFGNYRIYMFDQTNNEIILDFFDVAEWMQKNISIDLTRADPQIVPYENYTLRIALDTGSEYTAFPFCAMFDNMRYEVIAEPLDDSCPRGCRGMNYWSFQIDSNGVATCTSEENSKKCLSGNDEILYYESCERFCPDESPGDELIPTDDCSSTHPDYDIVYDSPNCESATQEDIYDDTVTATTLMQEGAELMHQRFFWALLITIAGLIGSTVLTKEWRVGFGVGIILTLFFVASNWYPWYVGTAFVVVLGLMIGKEWVGQIFQRGGG